MLFVGGVSAFLSVLEKSRGANFLLFRGSTQLLPTGRSTSNNNQTRNPPKRPILPTGISWHAATINCPYKELEGRDSWRTPERFLGPSSKLLSLFIFYVIFSSFAFLALFFNYYSPFQVWRVFIIGHGSPHLLDREYDQTEFRNLKIEVVGIPSLWSIHRTVVDLQVTNVRDDLDGVL